MLEKPLHTVRISAEHQNESCKYIADECGERDILFETYSLYKDENDLQ